MDNYRIFAILLIGVALVVYFTSSGKNNTKKKIEGMANNSMSNEALRNIASVYNNKDFYVQNLNVTGSFSHVPKGTIVIWKGSTNNIPSGWVLCNGQNGTPNLINRYPIGFSSAGALQGKSISASGNTNTAGNHSHSIRTSTNSPLYDVGLCCKPSSSARSSAGTAATGNHAHNVTINRLNSVQLNRFTALFIMKT